MTCAGNSAKCVRKLTFGSRLLVPFWSGGARTLKPRALPPWWCHHGARPGLQGVKIYQLRMGEVRLSPLQNGETLSIL